MKIALSYMTIIVAILILLNTYPIFIYQDSVFQNKRKVLLDQATLVARYLSGEDELKPDEVGRIMRELGTLSSYRALICGERCLVVYDNSLNESAIGKYALQGEVVSALSGLDVFRCVVSENAFESIAATPIITRGKTVGAVYLYEYDSGQAALLVDLRNNLSTFSVIITAIVVIISIFISMALTRRVAGLLQAIGAVRSGEYGRKAPVKGHDELAHVAGQFNELSDILYRNEQLHRQFVSDASHELKTPLAAIRLLADSVLQNKDMDTETIRDFMEDIGSETERLSRMTERLMQLTRLEAASPAEQIPVDPAPLILRAKHMLAPLSERARVDVRCELAGGCLILGNEDDLYTVVYNLMENAVKYNRPDGLVRVLCYTRDVYVHLIVDDTGIGIPKDELPHVFKRFYRVDKARSREAGGAGLGLSIVWLAIERMGGSISVESISGKGARFTVSFPTAGVV